MNIIGFILISRNPKSRTKSLGTIEKSRKKSSGSEDVFYREEKNGKVSYEFNATYRKPSDSGWVSETRIKPDISWKTKKLQPEIEIVSNTQEKLDMFDVTSAKLFSKEIQRYFVRILHYTNISITSFRFPMIANCYFLFYLLGKRYQWKNTQTWERLVWVPRKW